MIAVVSIVRSREEWAQIINSNWRKSIENIIQTGRDLIAAKGNIGHGSFGEMCKRDLDFSQAAAEKLMQIAEHPRISNSSTSTNLPSSWSVLAELAKLSENDFIRAEGMGLINSNTQVRGARATVAALNTEEGGIVGEGSKQPMRPSPDEARKIARATNTLVAASDGNIYSGATKEEGEVADERMNLVYNVKDAVTQLANVGLSAAQFLEIAKSWQLWTPEEKPEIADAIVWLADLQNELEV